MNPLSEKIRAEIRDHGPIAFARFMQLALYCPVYGYYEKEADTLGRGADYYTSVSVGPLFGELLAMQFAAWIDELAQTATGAPFHLVEAGAHKGDFARDALSWLERQRPDLFASIQYCIVEPSERRQEWQRRTLGGHTANVRWVRQLSESGISQPGNLDERGVVGVIFSNELLDAMPVHRFGWDAAHHRWFEWGVSIDRDAFIWVPVEIQTADPGAAADLHKIPQELLARLPDGFVVETCPAADAWWAEAAELLHVGKLMTIDYGFTADEWLTPERLGGTLRAYRRHTVTADVLAHPGEQDLTAHVNFFNLCDTGEKAGLKTEGLLQQEQFLTRIVARVVRSAPVPGAGTPGQESFGPWTADQVRQFQTLTHPGHLGHAFRVLIQSRSVQEPAGARSS